jgi:hypothetical protein
LQVWRWKALLCGEVWMITPDSTAKKLENREIVTSGVRVPKAAEKLLGLLNRYSAHEHKTISKTD